MTSFTKRGTSVIFYHNILPSRNFLWSCTIYENIWRHKVAGLLKLIALYTRQWPGITRLSSRYNFVLYWIAIVGLAARTECLTVVACALHIVCNGVNTRSLTRDLVCYLFALSSKTSSFLAKLLRSFVESYWKEILHVGSRMCSLLQSDVQRSRTATHRTPKYCRLASALFPSWMSNLH
jgi:hypothetical protein